MPNNPKTIKEIESEFNVEFLKISNLYDKPAAIHREVKMFYHSSLLSLLDEVEKLTVEEANNQGKLTITVAYIKEVLSELRSGK